MRPWRTLYVIGMCVLITALYGPGATVLAFLLACDIELRRS